MPLRQPQQPATPAQAPKPAWRFAKPGPGSQRQRNSKLDEHFAGSGSDRAGDLAREGAQNAGDAALNHGAGPVRIRIAFGELSADRAAAYSAGLMNHVEDIAKQKGMEGVNAVKADQPCAFLTFEDFNTTGLTGNPDAERRYDGDPSNAFHTFFRAEGQTDKVDDRKQGSKGVGKVTFLAASHARAVFGLTCRHDDARTLLFGTAVLHTHRRDGNDYDGDAWFGRADADCARPIEDTETIERFRDDFNLARQFGEPGFSIVIPWLDTNEEDGVTSDRLIDAVLRDHAWPILQNKLVVEVVAPDGATTTIDAAHFLSVLDTRSGTLKAQVRPLAELAAWALSHPPAAPTDRLGFHKDGAPAWGDPDLLTTDHRDRLRTAIDGDEPIAVRVPVRLRPKGRGVPAVDSYFDLFLRRDSNPAASASVPGATVQFVRSGLLISGMGKRLAGWRALVVASDAGLAGFLRAAENPSHTKWNAKPIKEHYTFAPATLSFVVESAKHLATLLAGDPTEKDATIWANEFSLPAGDEKIPGPKGAGTKQKRKQKTKAGDPPPVPPPPPKKRPYEIVVIPGGFSAKPSGRPFAALPARLDLQLAYHVRGKDPLSRWVRDDFDLTRQTVFAIEARGCEVIQREPNTLAIRIDAADFELRTTGFDMRRELFCKPHLEKPAASQDAGPDEAPAGDEPLAGVEGGAQ